MTHVLIPVTTVLSYAMVMLHDPQNLICHRILRLFCSVVSGYCLQYFWILVHDLENSDDLVQFHPIRLDYSIFFLFLTAIGQDTVMSYCSSNFWYEYLVEPICWCHQLGGSYPKLYDIPQLPEKWANSSLHVVLCLARYGKVRQWPLPTGVSGRVRPGTVT